MKTDQTTIENNKLIAEFMGWKIRKSRTNGMTKVDTIYGSLLPYDLLFHNSWDWLMPVVTLITEKTKSIYPNIHDSFFYDSIKRNLLSTNIKSVYNSVVDFIEWYNTSKKST